MQKNASRAADTGLPNFHQAHDSGSLVAFLLAPLTDAELHDPELTKLEQRAHREARTRAEDAWHIGFLRVLAANEKYKYLTTKRLIEHLTKSSSYVAAWKDEVEADNAWRAEIVRQIRIPSGARKHVAWKKKHLRYLNVLPWSDHLPRLTALVEAEERKASNA